jgi:hypothetical protein
MNSAVILPEHGISLWPRNRNGNNTCGIFSWDSGHRSWHVIDAGLSLRVLTSSTWRPDYLRSPSHCTKYRGENCGLIFTPLIAARNDRLDLCHIHVLTKTWASCWNAVVGVGHGHQTHRHDGVDRYARQLDNTFSRPPTTSPTRIRCDNADDHKACLSRRLDRTPGCGFRRDARVAVRSNAVRLLRDGAAH